MDFITWVFLIYSFIAFYFLFLFILTYFQNKSKIFWTPPITKKYEISIVLTCYNEGKSIGKAIENIVKNGYSGLKKVIVVDDCSKDNSYEIIQKYAKKYPDLILAVQTPKNTGCAAGAKNYGAKFANTFLIGFTDGDSFPEKGAIEKTIGFFDDEKVGAVTSNVLVKNRENFILKLQSIEYKVIKFSRKLLEFLDSIYVTPGPLAVYRKSAFDEIGGFDEKNLTEDIEITWHLQSAGYKIKMSVPSKVYSIAPKTIKAWIHQRNRWNIGGLQTIWKYKAAFTRKGMLGAFILPFFILSWVLGLFGLGFLVYRLSRTLIVKLLATSYSVQAHTAILRASDINLTFSTLLVFGLSVFCLSLWFTLVALLNVKESKYKRENFFTVGFYMIFYLLFYPIILIISSYRLIKGDLRW
ncbi:MAG: glycosyltransferase family 2 protein [Nanoarchaeota archaeon]|nr:glycosyltransferase family 2 protein [Nanoarchaeota archaeon]